MFLLLLRAGVVLRKRRKYRRSRCFTKSPASSRFKAAFTEQGLDRYEDGERVMMLMLMIMMLMLLIAIMLESMMII